MQTPYMERTTSVTITTGTSLSPAVSTRENKLVGFIVVTGWTTAAVTFQGSFDGTTFFNLWTDTGEYATAAVAANTFVSINPLVFLGLHSIRVRSGTAASPVNQGSTTIVTLVVTPL